jgi:uncharacterized metal-binding protein
MAEECCVPGGNVMILACSGCSNVGQIANQCAVELTKEGFGKMACLAGVGAHLSGFVQSAKDAPQMVAIDGCSIGCAKAILGNADVPLISYVVLTDLGIEKNKDLNLKQKDIDGAKEAVRKACDQFRPPLSSAGTGDKGCCS